MPSRRRDSEGMSDRELLIEIREAVYGDDTEDKPGLKLRVDRLEQWNRLGLGMAGITSATGITWLVNWIMSKFQGHGG